MRSTKNTNGHEEKKIESAVGKPNTISAHCPLPTAHCPLPTAHCPLPTAHCPRLCFFFVSLRALRGGSFRSFVDYTGVVSDWFYDLVWYTFWPAFGVSSSPIVLHAQRTKRSGGYILAANHISPLDVACLIKESHRRLDFVSIVELFHKPLLKWFYGNMNAFPIDRARINPNSIRTLVDRLQKGRVVAIFPEGGIKTGPASVLNGGRFKPGVLRLARMANVPIIPAVVLGTTAYHKVANWLPLRRTQYGIAFGEPIEPGPTADDELLGKMLRESFLALKEELMLAMSSHAAT